MPKAPARQEPRGAHAPALDCLAIVDFHNNYGNHQQFAILGALPTPTIFNTGQHWSASRSRTVAHLGHGRDLAEYFSAVHTSLFRGAPSETELIE